MNSSTNFLYVKKKQFTKREYYDAYEIFKLNNSFYEAIRCNDANTVYQLIHKKDIELHSFDNVAIRWAARNGHAKIVKKLLKDSNVDPAVNDNSILKETILCCEFDIVKILLKDSRVFNTLKRRDIVDGLKDCLLNVTPYLKTAEDVNVFVDML